MSDDPHAFQKLVLEAVQSCGADVECVEAFVEARMGTMNPMQRETMHRQIQRVLGFREPDEPYKDQ